MQPKQKRLAAATGLVLALAWPIPASPSLIAAKTLDCRAGEYVVGLAGQTGAWIDAVAPVCARWDGRRFQADPARTGPFGGGRGGGANNQSCPAGSAISTWQVERISTGDQSFAEAVSAKCRTLAPAHSVAPGVLRLGGGGSEGRRSRAAQERCPAGQLATGVSAWLSLDGRFVTDIKMRCAAAPFVSSAMTWQNGPNGAVTYNSPSLKLTSGDGVRLDWCREWATNCGQPAADAFCATKGKVKASRFTMLPNAGLTVVISNKQICNAPGCASFSSIECSATP